MWLPKDERKLLAYYYRRLEQVNVRDSLFLSELEKCLHGPNTRNRVLLASERLMQRIFLDFLNNQGDALTVQLSLQGFDLGRKYSSLWTRSGLCFAEYKDHWFWLIISFLGGIVGALIVNWLSK